MSYGYYDYKPVSRIEELAEENFRKLSKKRDLSPVIIEGRTIAKNWWGKSWCDNLKKYADYDNRINRGKSYVSHKAIIDLSVNDGVIEAIVQGSRKKPYNVCVFIDKCNESSIKKLKEKSLKEIENIDDLLNGKFPKDLGKEFVESNLFPNTKEIKYSCDCPDYASLCKHISCVLYGIGARLDSQPELLFSLRGIKVEDMISKRLKDDIEKIVKNEKTTKRKIVEEDINELFEL